MSTFVHWEYKLRRMHSWWSKCGLQMLSFQVATFTSSGSFLQHLEQAFSITEAFLGVWRCSKPLGTPFMMLPKCFAVLFSDGCVPETLLRPEANLLFRSQNLWSFSWTGEKFECWHSSKGKMTLPKGRSQEVKSSNMEVKLVLRRKNGHHSGKVGRQKCCRFTVWSLSWSSFLLFSLWKSFFGPVDANESVLKRSPWRHCMYSFQLTILMVLLHSVKQWPIRKASSRCF